MLCGSNQLTITLLQQKLDEEFQLKIKDNQVKAEERTAKRRLKR